MAARQEPDRPAPAAPTPPAGRQFTGTLRGGVVAIGAETTGWVLETADRGRLDVDVSKVAAAAEKLEGQAVVIKGELVTANWVERGEKQLLMAESIAPAAGAGK